MDRRGSLGTGRRGENKARVLRDGANMAYEHQGMRACTRFIEGALSKWIHTQHYRKETLPIAHP